MGSEERFYDLLFELSNDIRHSIMLFLLQKPERMTVIGNTLELTSPEVSRHLSRLSEKNLVEKDNNNYYYVTNFGEYLLNSLVDLEFISKNMLYFLSHSATRIPIKYQKRLYEISDHRYESNFMEFMRFITDTIERSTEFTWMFVDQAPLFVKDSINRALEKGVRIKILGPEIESFKKMVDGKYQIEKPGSAPSFESKQKQCDIYLLCSDQGNAISFPTIDGIDYTGFVTENTSKWVRELFNYYWDIPAKTDLLCVMCNNPITENPLIEVIDGKELVFDSRDCVQTYKRLREVYGEKFS